MILKDFHFSISEKSHRFGRHPPMFDGENAETRPFSPWISWAFWFRLPMRPIPAEAVSHCAESMETKPFTTERSLENYQTKPNNRGNSRHCWNAASGRRLSKRSCASSPNVFAHKHRNRKNKPIMQIPSLSPSERISTLSTVLLTECR